MPTFPTSRPIDITIAIAVGDVRVTAGDRSDVTATVLPTDPSKAADVKAAEETNVELHDERLSITTPKTWKRYSPFGPSGSVQVAVDAPTGSTLDASTSMGAIRTDGELEGCRARSSLGDIRVDHCDDLTAMTSYGDVTADEVRGDADVKTSSGEIRLGEVRGVATVWNSNGGTTIGGVSGDVRVKTSNGSVTIGRADASVRATSAAGSIEVGSLHRGAVVLETSVGNVTCGIAEGTAVHLDVRSQHGRIHSGLDTADGPGVGAAVVELRARTTLGDITLHRTSDRAHPAS
jgi:hypothetical protein